MSKNIFEYWNKIKNMYLNHSINNSISSNNSTYIDSSINKLSSDTSSYVDNSIITSNSNTSIYLNNSMQQIKSENSIYTNNKINQLSSENSVYTNNKISSTSVYINTSINNLSSNISNNLNNYLKLNNNNVAISGGISNFAVVPNTNQYNYIYFIDQIKYHYGSGIFNGAYSNGQLGTYLYVASSMRSSNAFTYMGIGINNDGTQYTYAPHPNINSSTNTIATTKWVRDVSALTSNGIVLKSYQQSGSKSYYEFTNGLLIQTGIDSPTSSGLTSITFLKSFKDATYTCFINHTYAAATDAIASNRTKTYFQYNHSTINDYYWLAIGLA